MHRRGRALGRITSLANSHPRKQAVFTIEGVGFSQRVWVRYFRVHSHIRRRRRAPAPSLSAPDASSVKASDTGSSTATDTKLQGAYSRQTTTRVRELWNRPAEGRVGVRRHLGAARSASRRRDGSRGARPQGVVRGHPRGVIDVLPALPSLDSRHDFVLLRAFSGPRLGVGTTNVST